MLLTLVALYFLSDIVEQGYCTLPVVLSTTVLSKNTCSSFSDSSEQVNAVKATVQQVIKNRVHPMLNPISSSSCNGTGWTRVAFLDMADSDENCPSNFSQISSPVRGCFRNSTFGGCNSVQYEVFGIKYNELCGRILGYQKGTTDGFQAGLTNASIETVYVDGVSLTHGPPGTRQHIWTFAAGMLENFRNTFQSCPCAVPNWPHQVPEFVRGDYFCESGALSAAGFNDIFIADPLWDGKGCSSSRCCQFNNPPWLKTVLPQTTADTIELRLCQNQASADENVIISLVELYVK